MVRVLISNPLILERIHSTAATHRHLRVVISSSHHLVLPHDLLLWHACLILIALIRSWLLLHIREYSIQPAHNIVWFWLNDSSSWLLLLLLLLLHLNLLILHELLLNSHLHSLLLLLLHHGGVHHLICHHLLAHHICLHRILLLWHHTWLRLSHEWVCLLRRSCLHHT